MKNSDSSSEEPSATYEESAEPIVLLCGCSELVPALLKGSIEPRSQSLSTLLDPTFERAARLIVLGPRAVGGSQIGEVIPLIREAWPLVDVLLWKPDSSAALVRTALTAGAKDVILDSSLDDVAAEIRGVIDAQQLLPRAARLERSSENPAVFEGMVSRSRRMWDLFDLATQVATSDATVLILGETGTGKELLARAIHRHSLREGRFVAINCGAVNEQLIDSELFGHEKGAFTGAAQAKSGLFRHADGGTLMLDEVGNVPLAAQYRLLRVLQEGAVRPVGGHKEVNVDVRVVAATSSKLEDDVQRGSFREDLFYRLDVLRLEIPPLRERPNDILFLFGHFAKHVSKQYNVQRPDLTSEFIDCLVNYNWPGNVRQLENFTERLVLTHYDQRVAEEHFMKLIPFRKSDATTTTRQVDAVESGIDGGDTDGLIDTERTLEENVAPVVESRERAYLEACLGTTGGRVGEAAKIAGISRRTLLRKLNTYGIDKRHYRTNDGARD